LRVVVSWSGGKESALACYEAIRDGLEVSYLLNFISQEGRTMSHGLDPKVIAAQAHAIGIPLIQRKVTWESYEEEFKAAMRELKKHGLEGGVFGDIDIQQHIDWVTRVCGEVGIIPFEPLWGRGEEQVLADFIREKFEAIVVSVKANLFDVDWLGRKVDRDFIEDLKALKLKSDFHLCGELGEYHTFVTDGPLFKKRIKLINANKLSEEGHWFLDISDYKIVEK